MESASPQGKDALASRLYGLATNPGSVPKPPPRAFNVGAPPRIVMKTTQKAKLSPIKSFRPIRNKSDLRSVKVNLGRAPTPPKVSPERTNNGGISQSRTISSDRKPLPGITPSPSSSKTDGAGGDTAVVHNNLIKSVLSQSSDASLSPSEICKMVRSKGAKEFMYLMPRHGTTSNSYHPYDLMLVKHPEIDPNNFYTISSTGIQHVVNGLSEFTPLARWEAEYEAFTALRLKKTFSQFRMWKQYSTWRKVVVRTKCKNVKVSLVKNAFLLDSELQNVLLDVRNLCLNIVEQHLCQIEPDKTYTLQEFVDAQHTQVKKVKDNLDGFRDDVIKHVLNKCQVLLAEKERVMHEQQNPKVLPGLEKKNKGRPSYTEEAAKAKLCQRLTNFIRLVDFLIAGAMQSLANEAIAALKDHMSMLEEIYGHGDGDGDGDGGGDGDVDDDRDRFD